ncbi:unnamed protein product [Leptidea sinapis]|uniref:Ig-like domain-containing protein n=1 Tax=Leptidea sinapis TaxID=189913 RepID=A0A5E4R2E2_9NEOP|nr:unnamed protein product [Leptidea sinapis]
METASTNTKKRRSREERNASKTIRNKGKSYITEKVPPVITIRNQLVGAALGTDLVLECETEAFPKPVSYWSREDGEIVPIGGSLEPQRISGTFRSVLRLSLRRIKNSDYGSYKCVSKNSLGDTEGTIKLYPMPPPALENKNGL